MKQSSKLETLEVFRKEICLLKLPGMQCILRPKGNIAFLKAVPTSRQVLGIETVDDFREKQTVITPELMGSAVVSPDPKQ